MKSYDYIIVGAGSAGCVLANRLSAEKGVSVLLLEAGGRDSAIYLKMPLYAPKLWFGHRYGWGYESEKDPNLNGRSIPMPRGKVLGGSSSINGMMYARGHSRDYDQWRQMGATGWSYADILPYYKRLESDWRGEGKYHGASGPLRVTRHDKRGKLYEPFRDAAVEMGYPESEDFHGDIQEGIGVPDFNTRDGKRGSTSVSFLRPALGRPNLTVETGAHATRVIIEKSRATGIEYVKDGKTEHVGAGREVILSGGAINSPQLLMLSGIGPADELSALGITPILDLPGVGRNLQEHASTGVEAEAKEPISYINRLRFDRMTLAMAQWLLFGTGPIAGMPVTGSLFVRTREGLERPDIQFMISPLRLDSKMWMPPFSKPPGHFFSIRAVLLHPDSRGWVKLRSADPMAPPRVLLNLMDRPSDLATMRQAFRIARQMFATGPLARITKREVLPGPAVQTDAQLDAFIRGDVRTAFHPVSTCAMGEHPDSVVDASLKVRGIEGLRVVDASVMPTIIGGNTNAPTIMIAEKASDMILGRAPLAPAEI